jgi:hypothetical protein
MASDFNKLIYKSVERQVKGQLALGDHKLTSTELRKLMDIAMEQFADSLVALVSSVARAQAEVKRTMAPASVPLPEGISPAVGAATVSVAAPEELKADPVVSEPAE